MTVQNKDRVFKADIEAKTACKACPWYQFSALGSQQIQKEKQTFKHKICVWYKYGNLAVIQIVITWDFYNVLYIFLATWRSSKEAIIMSHS